MAEALRNERRVRLLGQQPDVHWESMRDERRACYAETDAALAAYDAAAPAPEAKPEAQQFALEGIGASVEASK